MKLQTIRLFVKAGCSFKKPSNFKVALHRSHELHAWLMIQILASQSIVILFQWRWKDTAATCHAVGGTPSSLVIYFETTWDLTIVIILYWIHNILIIAQNMKWYDILCGNLHAQGILACDVHTDNRNSIWIIGSPNICFEISCNSPKIPFKAPHLLIEMFSSFYFCKLLLYVLPVAVEQKKK